MTMRHRASRRESYGPRVHELRQRRSVDVGELEITLKPRTCVGCGCTDDQACAGGCWWTYLDPADGGPLCSSCAPAVA